MDPARGVSDRATPAVRRGVLRAGAWVLVALGTAHLAGGLADLWAPVIASPIDLDLRSAMAGTPYVLAALVGSRNSIFEASVGWNASHSLGIAHVGAVVLLLSRSERGRGALSLAVPFAMIFCALYVVLASVFWFWGPLLGFAAAFCLLGAGWLRTPRATGAPREAGPSTGWLLAGAAPMGLAGLAHGLATFADLFGRGFFHPVDADVRRRMSGAAAALPATLGATRDVWTAYLGFNFSHGAGVFAFALLLVLLARRDPQVFVAVPGLRWVPCIFAACWLIVSASFFFWLPTAACVISTTCFGFFAMARADGPARS